MYKLFFADVTPYYNKKKFDQDYKKVCDYRKAKIDKCKDEKDKARSLVAGLLFEEACKEYGLEELLPYLADGEHGKPYFNCDDDAFPGRTRMYFNISHSEDCVLVGIADSEIGVDIQYMKPLKTDLASRCFTEKEQDMYYSAPDEEYVKVFYRIWCLKESFVKFTGNGLREGMNTFSVLDHLKDSGVWQEEYIYAVTLEDYRTSQEIANFETVKPKTDEELAEEEIKDADRIAATPKPQEIIDIPELNEKKDDSTPKPEEVSAVSVTDTSTPVPKDYTKPYVAPVWKVPAVQKVTFVIQSKDLLTKEISMHKNRRFRNKTKLLRMK